MLLKAIAILNFVTSSYTKTTDVLPSAFAFKETSVTTKKIILLIRWDLIVHVDHFLSSSKLQ